MTYSAGPRLRIVLPKGSLERATFELFDAADLSIRRSSEVDYRATIDDPRIGDVRIFRPQEIPVYVSQGLFDLGITGRDWIEETASVATTVGELNYSKNSTNSVRVVLAIAGDSPAQSVTDLAHGVRVATEFPSLTQRFFERHGIRADILPSYGATEAKIPEIADAVVDITETGRAIRAAGLRILETILVSRTELIANPQAFADPEKRHAMEQLYTLLRSTLSAREQVLVKLNVATDRIDAVIAILPAAKTPTVSKLFGDGGFGVESVVPKRQINVLIPALKDAGATDILEIPLSKIVP